MRITVQQEFADPDWADQAVDEPLIIHQRTTETGNQRLVIFVHGLGGSRYGTNSTWGNFPKFLYEDILNADIGLYSYRTALGRLKFWKSTKIEAQAEILATRIRELQKYKSIVLIGHSMGGILAKGAIAHLAKTNQKKVLKRLNGLFLMASPQLGSLKIPRLFRRLSPDAWVLAPHSDIWPKSIILSGIISGLNKYALRAAGIICPLGRSLRLAIIGLIR
jgi:pimeloyl-ACP methyl ester carboxylesterase